MTIAIGGSSTTGRESTGKSHGTESAVPKPIERETAWKTTVTGAESTMLIGIMTATMAGCTSGCTRKSRSLVGQKAASLGMTRE